MRLSSSVPIAVGSAPSILSYSIALSLLFLMTPAYPQINYEIETNAFTTIGEVVPFWMRTNNHGSLPLAGTSISFLGRAEKDYPLETDSSPKKRNWSWGMGLETRLNSNLKKSNLFITEGFLKARIGLLELKAGRSKENVGLVDSTLSSGAFSISGNALGIPKITASITNYWALPILNKFISVKGDLSHGWLGRQELGAYTRYVSSATTYYHQLSIYGKLGKPTWKISLSGGINHQAMWGDEKSIFGEAFTLSRIQRYLYVLSGKRYGNSEIPSSKIGDHLGSLDQEIEYRATRIKIKVYHQFFYTTGGLYYLSNIKDGLTGVSIENRDSHGNRVRWNKVLVEFLNTKSQGGELNAPLTPSGAEVYYHSMYKAGWTYKQENLGSNFLTNRNYARTGLIMRDNAFIINNRLQLIHLGLTGIISRVLVQGKFSFSKNYGTYATSPIGTLVTNVTPDPNAVWVGGRKRIIYPGPYFKRVNQFSAVISSTIPTSRNSNVGIALAVDHGKLLKNSLGCSLSAKIFINRRPAVQLKN